MARRISRKQIKQDEFIETAFDVGHWFEKHWLTLTKWGGVALVVLIAALAWRTYSAHREERALEVLALGVSKYSLAQQSHFEETVGLESALTSFEEAKRSGSAKASRTARFYEGAALLRLKRYDEAKTALEGVGQSAPGEADTVGAMAQALLASVLQTLGRGDEALSVLGGMLQQDNPAIPRDQILFELAQLERKADRPEAAREHLQRILDEFPQSPMVAEARQFLK